MKNKIEIWGDTIAILVTRRNGVRLKVLIDTDDLERLQKIKMSIYCRYKKSIDNYYVQFNYASHGPGSKVSLHRFIMNPPRDLVVDHINHNTLDNRKINLRVVTAAENNRNRKVKNSCIAKTDGNKKSNKNKSSSKAINNKPPEIKPGLNVTWDKERNKWRAKVKLDNKNIHIGRYDTKDGAVRAVEKFYKTLRTRYNF